jgi:hypothetical protein
MLAEELRIRSNGTVLYFMGKPIHSQWKLNLTSFQHKRKKHNEIR